MRFSRLNIILVTLTLVCGCTLTLLGVRQARRYYQDQARAQFDRLSEHLGNEVQRRMNLCVYGLKGARGIFAASQVVSRSEFRRYVESRDLSREFPGIMGFGYIQRVMRPDVAKFVAEERADDAPDYTVKTSGDAPDLWLIKYIEPPQDNREAWGYDIGSEQIRRTAVEQAVRTGDPTLTGHITLVQDHTKRPGFLFLLPVYRNGTHPTTPDERMADLAGVVYAPIVIDRIFSTLLEATDEMIDVEVFEGPAIDPANLLLDADHQLVSVHEPAAGAAHNGRMFHDIRHLRIGGQEWTLSLSTTPKFDASVDRSVPLLTGLSGGLITLLFAGVIFALGRSRARALELAHDMTTHLRESEAEARRLAMVASRTNNAVIITDADGLIEWANDGFTRITGYQLDDVKGRAPGSFLQGALTDRATIAQMHDGIVSGRGFTVEVINYHKSGRPYWIAIEVQPLRDAAGAITGFMAIESDINERKIAEEKLLANEQRLTALTREVPGVIFQFEVSPDNHRSFSFLSEGYRELFGRDPAEAKARPIALFGTVHPKDRSLVRRSLEHAVSTGHAWLESFRIIKPDGTVRWIDARSTATSRPDGTKVWFGVLTNITELQESRFAAEQAMVRAEQASRAKSQFLAMMSHEIRTPMNGVIGMTSLLLDTPLNAQQREFTEIVRSSGETLLTLINDILDFSKIESGRMDLENEVFSIRECVESSLDLFAHKAAQKGIDLLYEIGENVPVEVRGDITRLRQIMVNLMSNALKFTERGEIELTVRNVRAEDGIDELRFSVRDTGIGIPAEAQGRLFNSFSQVDASTTRKYGGTGLGLAISKRLAEMMGGRMWVESEVGRGSTFIFTVRVEWIPVGVKKFVAVERPILRGKRLLAVDDNATSRRILAGLAEKWDMPCTVVETGAEALELLKDRTPFDVILSDMQMPEMDGVMFARAVQALPADRVPPVILISSIGRQPGTETQGLFAAVITKPVKPSLLFDALAHLFGSSPPFAIGTPAAPEPAPQPAGTPQPERILLAEDNSVNQKVALHMLARLGFRADAVADGQEAVKAVQEVPYDIVLMDVQMPEMDGLEATRIIKRAMPAGRAPWIIALTANAMEGDRELCLQSGMDDYLGKPIKSAELAAALARAQQAIRED